MAEHFEWLFVHMTWLLPYLREESYCYLNVVQFMLTEIRGLIKEKSTMWIECGFVF